LIQCAIIKRLQENEAVAKKFHAVEAKILTILDFKDLFEILLTEIRTNFNVPYVWISMARHSEVSSLIESLGDSDMLKEHMNIIDKDAFLELIRHKTAPTLVNENLKPYFKLLPRNNKFFFKSIAVAPLSLDGDIIGSLNQADASPYRFEPGIDTTLLEQLALKVSICLSNVTAHEKLKFFAYHDHLTGLLNRRVLEKILGREIKRAERYDSPLSLALINLTNFKKINEAHGHEQGDNALVYAAETLTKVCRQSDIVARFDGDKFVIILPSTQPQAAEGLMQRLESYFQKHPLETSGMKTQLGINYGITSFQGKGGDDSDQLLKNAEQALSAGKNRTKKKKSKKQGRKVIDFKNDEVDRKKT